MDVSYRKRLLFDWCKEGNVQKLRKCFPSATLPITLRDTRMCNSVLHYAAESGQIETMKYLIECKCDIDARNEYSETPLHFAVDSKDIFAAKLLIEHKAELDVHEELFSRTPLHWAIQNFQVEMIKLLITYKASVNACDFRKRTPLLYAVKKRFPFVNNTEYVNDSEYAKFHTIFTLLLSDEVGTDVARTDDEGFSALHFAVSNNDYKAVKLLIQHKADVNVQSEMGDTPLLRALKGSSRVMAAIESCDTFCDFGAAKSTASYDILDRIKKLFLTVSFWNPQTTQITPQEYRYAVKFILKAEADVNATHFDGCTALHKLLSMVGYHPTQMSFQALKCLIASNADLNAVTRTHETPLLLAFQIFDRSRDQLFTQNVIKELIGNGASLSSCYHWLVANSLPRSKIERALRNCAWAEQKNLPILSRNVPRSLKNLHALPHLLVAVEHGLDLLEEKKVVFSESILVYQDMPRDCIDVLFMFVF